MYECDVRASDNNTFDIKDDIAITLWERGRHVGKCNI